MFGIRYFKFQPSEYVLRYKKGNLIAEGTGLSFFCYTPPTSIAVLPAGSIDIPFIFEEGTSDFQTVTMQGQLTYKIADPQKTASMLDYSIRFNRNMDYRSDDPHKLPKRLSDIVKVLAKKHLEQMSLYQAVRSSEALGEKIFSELCSREEINQLGLEVLGLSILAVLANKETERALEAQTREQILKTSDDAVYERRNASIEQERHIQENEYNTEISIENKKRQVRETQLEAQQSEQLKVNQLREEQLLYEIRLEEKRKELVALASQNAKEQADAKAYSLSVMMQALQGADATVVQSLVSLGMNPDKLMALAFQGIAENAQKIGQLNITPDLLREIVKGNDSYETSDR